MIKLRMRNSGIDIYERIILNKLMRHFIRILFATWFCTISSFPVRAQESISYQKSNQREYPHIEWVKSWPSADKTHQGKRIKDRLNSIFFGIKPVRLSNPVSVFAEDPDNFWILDQGNKAMVRVKKEVGEIPHLVSKSGLNLSSLVGICAGPNSSILFSDSHDGKIYRMLPGNKKISLLDDSLKLEQPAGIAYSPVTGQIWVVEARAHAILVLDEKGSVLKRFGSRGNGPGEFNYPTHIWIDKDGVAYITDALNFRVQIFSPEAKFLSLFGEAGDATGYFARPKGIATDSFGNIYVVDALFHVVQVFNRQGTFLYKFGSQGHGQGEFWMPSGIFIDDHDYIYVADSYNSRVQIFQLIHPGGK